MRVLISDCKYKMSLAPIRSLADSGYDVICGEYEDVPDELLLGSRSVKCGGLVRYGHGAEHIAAVCGEGDVVLPVGRETLRSFAGHPELKDKLRFLASPLAVLDMADDKAFVRKTAERLGIPAPSTFFPRAGESAAELAERVNYPSIIKYKNGEALGLKSWERYAAVRTPKEFEREYNRMSAASSELFAQDYLSGSDVGAAVVMDENSRPVDFLLYVSEREYPLSGGPTCLCRTVFDRGLLRYACSILSELGFRGIAMLDFKGTPAEPYLLEINPRVWGSASLCRVSGASFFESYVMAARGESEPLDLDTCLPRYRLDARMKFVPHSIVAAMKELKAGAAEAARADLRASFSGEVRDGLYERGDSAPFYRYITNLLMKKA